MNIINYSTGATMQTNDTYIDDAGLGFGPRVDDETGIICWSDCGGSEIFARGGPEEADAVETLLRNDERELPGDPDDDSDDSGLIAFWGRVERAVRKVCGHACDSEDELPPADLTIHCTPMNELKNNIETLAAQENKTPLEIISQLQAGAVLAEEHTHQITGWTSGDGTGHEGYHVSDYFDAKGRYLGPDAHGIEPIFRDLTDSEAHNNE